MIKTGVIIIIKRMEIIDYVDDVRHRNKKSIISYAGVERRFLKTYKFSIKITNAKMKPRPFITVIFWSKTMFILNNMLQQAIFLTHALKVSLLFLCNMLLSNICDLLCHIAQCCLCQCSFFRLHEIVKCKILKICFFRITPQI